MFNRRREQSTRRGGDERRAENQHPDIPLNDPGLPERDLTQITHRMLTDCGLTYVAYGPGPVADLYAEFRRVAPALSRCVPEPVGFATFRDSDEIALLGLESDRGSAIAVLLFPGADVEFAMKHLHEPLKSLASPWLWTIGTRSNKWNHQVATIINSARAIPVWDLPGFAHTRPSPAAAPIPKAFIARLVAQGWEQGVGDFFTTSITTRASRDRNVHLLPYNSHNFATMSVVCEATAEGSLPFPLRGCELGQFELMVTDDLVCLIGTLPAGPPSPGPEEVAQAAQAVADYAERLAEDLEVSFGPAAGAPAPPLPVASPPPEPETPAGGTGPQAHRLANGTIRVSWCGEGPGTMYKVSRQTRDGLWRVVARTAELSLEDGGADPTGPVPAYTVDSYPA